MPPKLDRRPPPGLAARSAAATVTFSHPLFDCSHAEQVASGVDGRA
jgi:hypothetical protein